MKPGYEVKIDVAIFTIIRGSTNAITPIFNFFPVNFTKLQ